MEKTSTSPRIINLMTGLFFILFAFTVGLLIYYDIAEPRTYPGGMDITYIENWVVTDDQGNTFTTRRSYRDDRMYKESFTITSHLPMHIRNDSLLCFTTPNSTSVYIDGKLRSEFDNDRDILLPGITVKNFYMTVPLSAADSGAELKMIRFSTSRRPQVVSETFVSDTAGVYHYLIGKYGFSFALSLIVLLLSGVIIIVSISMSIIYKKLIELLYASMAVFVISGWLVTNSYLYPYVFGHFHIDGVVNYMCCLMIPFCLLKYLDTIQHGRYRHLISGLMVLSGLNGIVWPILHFSGIYYFNKALTWIDVILALIIVVTFGIIVADGIRHNLHEYRFTAMGFGGFMFFGVIVIIVLTVFSGRNENIPMLLGLSWLLTLVVIQQVQDLRQISSDKQRAIALSDAKTQFLASMSHEIRTPINSILGMNEMILRENKDPAIDEYAGTIQNSGKMLLSLVNDVLDFSRIEAGKLEITNAPYSLSSVIIEIDSMIRERAVSKGLEFNIVIEDGVPDGQFSDEFRIRQILINLLNNAVKYTDSGNVTLTVGGRERNTVASESPDRRIYDLKLAVSDTGRGIRKEDQADLFDAFSRADIKRNRNIEGTGLGLAIVRRIIDSMSGTISVTSEYGEGSCFTASIPVEITDDTPASLDHIRSADQASTQTSCDYTAPDARILAVDDNTSNLSVVKLFLKRTLITPDLCSNGNDALKMCRRQKYDLILLDHMMPAPDGVETLRLIRTDDASLNRSTPAIVLTANALEGSREKYLAAGFIDYLTKPLDSAILEQTVRNNLPSELIRPAKTAPTTSSDVAMPDTPAYERSTIVINANTLLSLRERLAAAVPEIDYDTAISYCGEDDVLTEILKDISSESAERAAQMRQHLSDGNTEAYGIEAHAIKGLMATIGASKLSERARKLEFAAKDNDIEQIVSDSEDFLSDYEDMCRRCSEIIE